MAGFLLVVSGCVRRMSHIIAPPLITCINCCLYVLGLVFIIFGALRLRCGIHFFKYTFRRIFVHGGAIHRCCIVCAVQYNQTGRFQSGATFYKVFGTIKIFTPATSVFYSNITIFSQFRAGWLGAICYFAVC